MLQDSNRTVEDLVLVEILLQREMGDLAACAACRRQGNFTFQSEIFLHHPFRFVEWDSRSFPFRGFAELPDAD